MHFDLQQCGVRNVSFYAELEYAYAGVKDTIANSYVVSAYLPRAVVFIHVGNAECIPV